MPVIKIQTNFNIDLEFETAEFHRRLAAWFIDFFIQIFYLIIAGKVYDSLQGNKPVNIDNAYDSWAIGLVFILPYLLYHIVSEITMNGQSIGKKIMKIRVVNENGGRAGISQYIIRWLIRTSDLTLLLIVYYLILIASSGSNGNFLLSIILSAVGGAFLLFILDIILVASSKKSQRLGDMLAGTLLIRTRSKGNMTDTIFFEVAEDYVPLYPQIMQLSDRDINSIKAILDTAVKRKNVELAASATEKIKSHLKIESSLTPVEFLETVMKDYNYLSTR